MLWKIAISVQSIEEVFKQYAAQADTILQEVPGFRNLSLDDRPKMLEGTWKPAMIVVHEFPDYEIAQKLYYSDAYAPLIKLRQSATKANSQLSRKLRELGPAVLTIRKSVPLVESIMNPTLVH
ncbi:MAG: DUF1330 domain-containing protein [Paenibacillus macerans]|uniref:DUF1330 domain-containing protein n=2 Tax=Bacillales TaxID=1385 RepID=A0A090ZA55_PAEMA|nr:DUF1330 domain-containing protein [Paenibacillus macerans]KFN07065.1 hypothetical protein DJ90_4618 [Paenibacillus macerans]MCY7560623.1 DUF1330 domain-containing protein [Paenibacillus macerans]MDU7473685.1 DUF1330 domain-containing protein [Paenibacillus macerans]MEC0151048.1 DUF1330 domain-containing protein [Paenibacillus macerans]SUA85925.1 protein of uncharacterised function DUF1330 [Paenibacillus macerans]